MTVMIILENGWCSDLQLGLALLLSLLTFRAFTFLFLMLGLLP